MHYRPPCDIGCDANPGWGALVMLLVLLIMGLHFNYVEGSIDPFEAPATVHQAQQGMGEEVADQALDQSFNQAFDQTTARPGEDHA